MKKRDFLVATSVLVAALSVAGAEAATISNAAPAAYTQQTADDSATLADFVIAPATSSTTVSAAHYSHQSHSSHESHSSHASSSY